MEISYKDCEFDKKGNCWIVRWNKVTHMRVGMNSYPQYIIVEGQTGLRVAYYHQDTALHDVTHRYVTLKPDAVDAKNTHLLLQM